MLGPDLGDEVIADRARPSNLAVVPPAPHLILQEHQHRAALVRVRAAQAVGRVGARDLD